VAGLTIALLAGSGMLLRAAWGGEAAHLKALLVGALFVPTLALALGTASGTRKLFEMSYLLIWYLGPVNRLVPLDFPGVTPAAAAGTIPLISWRFRSCSCPPPPRAARQVSDGRGGNRARIGGMLRAGLPR
jgi:hypothetical protein